MPYAIICQTIQHSPLPQEGTEQPLLELDIDGKALKPVKKVSLSELMNELESKGYELVTSCTTALNMQPGIGNSKVWHTFKTRR